MQLTKHWAGQLDDYVIDLVWSPDGSRLVAASAAGPIFVFGGGDGAKQQELPGHENGTEALAWNPASTTAVLASGGQDGTVKFWDAAAGQHTATAELGRAWVDHLAWRVPTRGADQPALLFASAGRVLAALRADATIAHTFNPAPKTISALAIRPGGGAIAVAYFGGIVLWDADDFVAQKELTYANGIHTLAWSPDNRWLVSGNQDPSVHLWIPDEDVELHMSGYEGKVGFLSFDHTSRWLATSGGSDACIWDCAGAGPEGREPAMLPHDAPVCAVKFQNSHGLLATAAKDGVVQLWSPERKQPLRATVKMPTAPTKLAWSLDDRHLAIGSERGVVYVLKCEA
jgi:WD40 repeat protein